MSTIDELFNRDPLTLTVEDAKAIVKVVRERRAQWELAEAKRISEGKRQPKRAAGTTKGQLAEISLDELMGDGDA